MNAACAVQGKCSRVDGGRAKEEERKLERREFLAAAGAAAFLAASGEAQAEMSGMSMHPSKYKPL